MMLKSCVLKEFEPHRIDQYIPVQGRLSLTSYGVAIARNFPAFCGVLFKTDGKQQSAVVVFTE